MSQVSPTARIYPGVRLGEGVTVGDFVIIGLAGGRDADSETVISDGAIIRSHAVIYAGNRLGRNVQLGHGVMLREANTIGDNVSIGSYTVIEHHVTIGSKARIHSQAFIPEYCQLEDEAWVGPRVCFTNAKYPVSVRSKSHIGGVTVCTRARVGGNSTILPGVLIGRDALVGAGSVVTEDVPPRAVVVGNPARQIKTVDDLRYPNEPDVPIYY